MVNEITELLDTAIDREIAAEAFYLAAQKMTTDSGALALLKELAAREAQHREWVKGLKAQAGKLKGRPARTTVDLKISEGLTDPELTVGASLQDIITIALKREQYSIEFYNRLKPALTGEEAGLLCEKLLQEEQGHKHKLEVFYDDFFNQEN
jgi:rubrerythrin